MIKTIGDFREALDNMMEDKKSGHIRERTGTDDISVSSSDAGGEISMGAIFIPPRSKDKRG